QRNLRRSDRGHVPDHYGAIFAGAGQARAIPGEGQPLHLAGLADEPAALFTGDSVHQEYHVVVSAPSHNSPVGCECHRLRGKSPTRFWDTLLDPLLFRCDFHQAELTVTCGSDRSAARGQYSRAAMREWLTHRLQRCAVRELKT